MLLANHGIVCWADTVTHAEWYAEVLETYCWTLMLASQLGAPISYISEQQGSDLLALKKKLGLPDVRFDTSRMKECQLADLEMPNSIALTPTPCDGDTGRGGNMGGDAEVEMLVKASDRCGDAGDWGEVNCDPTLRSPRRTAKWIGHARACTEQRNAAWSFRYSAEGR